MISKFQHSFVTPSANQTQSETTATFLRQHAKNPSMSIYVNMVNNPSSSACWPALQSLLSDNTDQTRKNTQSSPVHSSSTANHSPTMSNIINETLCFNHGGVDKLPGLDHSQLYCLTPNVNDSTAISSLVQTCCGQNPLRKMGGCDYCVIDEPTSWSDNPVDWGKCVFSQARMANVSGVFATSCNVPGSGVALSAFGGRAAWAVWGLVVLVGFGFVEGSLL